MLEFILILISALLRNDVIAKYTRPYEDLSKEFIRSINDQEPTWKAGKNFEETTSRDHIKRLIGENDQYHNSEYTNLTYGTEGLLLPENYDPRVKWKKCPSLREIRDQGCCASAWVLSTVSTITDRVCIYTRGEKRFHMSAQDVLSCADWTGDCEGGNFGNVYDFWVRDGIVSGGGYNTKRGCRPYEIQPGFAHKPCKFHSLESEPELECIIQCQKGYTKPFEEDKMYGSKIYAIYHNESIMRAELFGLGPLTVDFELYSDFLSYKSGVYQHIQGEYLGFHPAKLLGWGVENGVKYWLLANSWSTSWGDKGFFKFLRGENHCGIEDFAVSGVPDLPAPERKPTKNKKVNTNYGKRVNDVSET